MRTLFLKAALGLSLGLGLSACGSTDEAPDPIWVEDVVYAPSESVLWSATLQSIRQLGFPVTSETNPNTMTILTGWKTQLAPYRGKGYRLRADVHFLPVDSINGKGPGWTVEARVMKQVNMALVKPLDLAYAEWEWRADDEWEAAILVRHILADFPATDILEKPME